MNDVTEHLIQDGFYRLPFTYDENLCDHIFQEIHKTRNFDSNIFLDQEAFESNPVFKGVNPRPGRNLYEDLKPSIDKIEQDPRLCEILTKLLGKGYAALHHKIVCGVPDLWIPEWVKHQIIGNPANNLGPYIRKEYRDMTYFYGIDYHQDIIDRPNRNTDFITLYVYIHPVEESDAPLHVLSGSHILGVTEFPHQLYYSESEDGVCVYSSDGFDSIKCEEIKIIGKTGTAALWHSATLHGTQPDVSDRERISLRFMYSRGSDTSADIDLVNNAIIGPLSLNKTRRDLDKKGSSNIKKNVINLRKDDI